MDLYTVNPDEIVDLDRMRTIVRVLQETVQLQREAINAAVLANDNYRRVIADLKLDILSEREANKQMAQVLTRARGENEDGE